MTTVQIKERPILFSGPMVRAILEGRKTMTRRIVKPQPTEYNGFWSWRKNYNAGIGGCNADTSKFVQLLAGWNPYGQPGDRLWVRETWVNNFGSLIYRADYDPDSFEYGAKGWKPSIFMPRKLSRITLEITDVRVERLQEISEEDAKAEGVSADAYIEQGFTLGSLPARIDRKAHNAREAFQYLWGKINGAESWESNPWVWVVSFKVVR